MLKRKKNFYIKGLVFGLFTTGVILSFQNCAPIKFSAIPNKNGETLSLSNAENPLVSVQPLSTGSAEIPVTSANSASASAVIPVTSTNPASAGAVIPVTSTNPASASAVIPVTSNSKDCAATQVNVNCTTVLQCASQYQPVGEELSQVVLSIPAVAHGQYSSITNVKGGSIINYRYKCNNGNFVFDQQEPALAPACNLNPKYLAASDVRCPQRNPLNDSCNDSPKTYHERYAGLYKNFSNVTSGTLPLTYLCDSGSSISTLVSASKVYYYVYDNCGEAPICDEQIDVRGSALNNKNFTISAACLNKLKEGSSYTINLYNPNPDAGVAQTFIQMHSYKTSVDFSPSMPRSLLTKQNGQIVMWGAPLAVNYKALEKQYYDLPADQALDKMGVCDSNSSIYYSAFRSGSVYYKDFMK